MNLSIKIPQAPGSFTPCTAEESLLEAQEEAARIAPVGDVVLLSTAGSSFDRFQNYQECGERFCQMAKSISWGAPDGSPNINGRMTET